VNHRAVKIIATVGPASADPSQLAALIAAGVDLFRFNFAHGSRDEKAATIALVHRLADDAGRPVGTLADISGPKIRLGKLPDDTFMLERDAEVVLHSPEADAPGLPVQLRRFDEYVQPGDPIYLADGTRKLIVTACGKGIVRTTVEVGGVVGSFKGINLPQLRKSLPAVGEKDLLDIECALKAGIDWIGLSFVGEPEDLAPVHECMQRLGIRRPVLAKLERRQALERLDEIITAFDGVMVARGDLGIEVEFERVPVIQDKILRTAQKHGKPAIVATQILTSMVANPRPTRAEVSDIAYAVAAGADALMLSEETAIGQYPVECVQTIIKVAREIESSRPLDRRRSGDAFDASLAIARTAAVLAQESGAAAIICSTRTGNTARSVARFRPGVPLIAISDELAVIGELTLWRGVRPCYIPLDLSFEERIATSVVVAERMGLALEGAKLVIVGGMPPGSHQTNLLFVHTVGKGTSIS
jgi:pyruvate kinase